MLRECIVEACTLTIPEKSRSKICKNCQARIAYAMGQSMDIRLKRQRKMRMYSATLNMTIDTSSRPVKNAKKYVSVRVYKKHKPFKAIQPSLQVVRSH